MKMKNLKRYQVGGTQSKMDLAIPVPPTPAGRVYRFSPNPDAHPRHFVLGRRVAAISDEDTKRGRMRQDPRTSKTVCPYSGFVGKDHDFTHPKDIEAAIKIVEHDAIQDVQDAVSDMLKGVASKSRGDITYKPSRQTRQLRPQFRRRDLMRLLVCDCCGRDYGVYAIALFCPDCGAPNVALHFEREVELVLRQVVIAEKLDEEQIEFAYRLLGNAHEDVLTAFEAVQKVVYLHKVSLDPNCATNTKPVRNDFQNVEKAKKRYAEFRLDPFLGLSDSEREALDLNIQKRHLIGHSLGVVDVKFAENAQDARLGETVELVGSDVREFAQLCQVVVKALDDWLADLRTPKNSSCPEKVALMNEQSIDTATIGERSVLATSIGRWICENSEKGLPEHVDESVFLAAFDHSSSEALEEALADLEIENDVELSHVIGPQFPGIRATENLFQVFDPVVLGTNPLSDAIILIDLILEGDRSVNIPKLHERSGLTLRSFNPALALVLEEIDGRRVNRTSSSDYPSRQFSTLAEDRIALKRLRTRLSD